MGQCRERCSVTVGTTNILYSCLYLLNYKIKAKEQPGQAIFSNILPNSQESFTLNAKIRISRGINRYGL
jgi:hypothetical protein